MSGQSTRNLVVSSDEEQLILVDSNDRETGTLSKSQCHDGVGTLHRAFSLFVFNRRGSLLIHQRHPSKRLWPDYWSNSCCSHPRAGEDMDLAVHRRLAQELGLNADLRYIYKFEYTAPFGDAGTEHELCWVYAGTTAAEPAIGPEFIAPGKFPVVGPSPTDRRWYATVEVDAGCVRHSPHPPPPAFDRTRTRRASSEVR
ncbi:MAG: isopentenyl-diphosphate Delta-isomerase [Proteobacteria bacterium]|nr:isopentenyl-diphosphate Delta-isomerase [Pseudomonadota bacterium]